jgi:hypothetical protein
MLLMSMMTLVACGGGDGDLTGGGDGEGGTSDTAKISISKSEGDLSATNDITISASLVLNSSGAAVVGKLITFTLNDPSIAVFDPVVGTAITDASGIATITVKVTDVAGGVEVTATAVGSDSDTGSASIGFTSAGDGVKIVEGEPQAASIRLFASSQQLASSGAQSIELSAIAKDNNNNLLEGVTINFASDSGALGNVLDASGNSSNVTGSDGKVTMELSTQDEPSNRVVLVTVTSGDITDSLEIEVVGTTVTLTGSASLALNDETNYIVNVLDSDGNGVAKTEVVISASKGDEITIPTSVTTDSEGQATVKVTGTVGGTNSIIVNALGATASQDVSVQADSFLFTSFSNGINTVNPSNTPIVPDVSLAQTASITLTWMRDNAPVPDGKSVSFTTTRGIVNANSATTVDGEVTVTLTSTNAGKALVTFVGSDVVDGKNVELSNQLEFEFFADTAATLIAQASPNSIGPNQQTSTISVVVRDPNGNLVKNKTIKFELEDISGGEIFPATAVTDSNGSASTVYSSKNTSAQNGVAIKATVIDNIIVTDMVNLTVADRELFITLGTGNTLEELGSTDYIKEYSVFVTDVDSNPVANVDLTISLIPDEYYKGYWVKLYDGDEFIEWVTNAVDGDVQVSIPPVRIAPISCDNEDINLNGILDFGDDLEDTNTDGVLTPGNVAVAEGTVTTDENGRAIVQITYGQSYARWVNINLIASAKVTGSESLNQTIFTLPVLATDINDEDLSPPRQGVGSEGPFGGAQNCSVPD